MGSSSGSTSTLGFCVDASGFDFAFFSFHAFLSSDGLDTKVVWVGSFSVSGSLFMRVPIGASPESSDDALANACISKS